MNKLFYIKLFIVVLGLSMIAAFIVKEETEISSGTEGFIKKYLENPNGTLATYMKNTTSEDEDEVKGREALSETMGLWMEYAVEKNDKILFEESYETLKKYFMDKDGFVYWKLKKSGESEVFANALVDDLRIAHVLFKAAEKWEDNRYSDTAAEISRYFIDHNVYKNTLTDFYERESKQSARKITLSYIEPQILKVLETKGLLPQEISVIMTDILVKMPDKSGFYPKVYDVDTKQYEFDETINMVDQGLIALYREKSGMPTSHFKHFIEEELNKENVIYGLYDLNKKEPVVEYESPALYGLLIRYALEANETALAKRLYQRMSAFKSSGKYEGGYSVYQKNTHIFDNIFPLLAEQSLYNQRVIDY